MTAPALQRNINARTSAMLVAQLAREEAEKCGNALRFWECLAEQLESQDRESILGHYDARLWASVDTEEWRRDSATLAPWWGHGAFEGIPGKHSWILEIAAVRR